MRTPTNITTYRQWLNERFRELEVLCRFGEPDFFNELQVAEMIEEAKRFGCRFGVGDLIEAELPTATPREGLAIIGRLLAWTEQVRPPELLTVEDVAAKLGASTRTVWRMLSADQVPQPVKVGGQTRWRTSDIEAMIDLLPRKAR